MDFNTIMLYGIGGVLVVYFLLYVFTAQNLLGYVLKRPTVKIIPRADCPGYIVKFFESKEKELLGLGFTYLYCKLIDDLYVKKYPRRYVFVYYNPGEKTYADLARSDAADNVIPFQVTFYTDFSGGKRLMTFNGLKHGVLGNFPGVILKDAYAETLEKHFRFHLEHLEKAAVKEGDIEEYRGDEPVNADEITREEAERYENYLKQLEKDGYIYNAGDNNYLIKTLPAIRFAHQMIKGLRKISTLRKKITDGQKGQTKPVDLPVELEVTNYLNTRAAFNQQIRNSGGKIFFLILSVLLFAAAFSLIISFEFVAILIAAIFLHECGHLLAMRFFGYKNLRMLFIPLFGAVAMGTDKDVAPYKKVITYFAGPVPGILLAFVLLIVQQHIQVPLLYSRTAITTLVVLVFINYFNLIPIMPFDGGQIFNTIIFSRFPLLQLIFNAASFIAALLLAILLQAPLLFFVALVIFFGMQQFFIRKRIMAAVKNDPQMKNNGTLSEQEILQKIFLFLRAPGYNKYSFQKKFRVVQGLETVLNTKKASMRTVVFTLIFYLFLFAAPVIYMFSTSWGPALISGLFPGAYSYKDPCETVRNTARPLAGQVSVEKSAFRRLSPAGSGGSSLVSYRYCFAAKDAPMSSHAGDFLSRIRASYGGPDEIENGLSYTFLDKKSGIIFTAYLERGVPAYGSPEKNNPGVIPALHRFEALLKNTRPADCHYVYKTPYGAFEAGAINGEPYFDRVLPSTVDKNAVAGNRVALTEPVVLRAEELDNMLYVYTAFFAIGHDKWIYSEASMVRATIEVSGLPAGLTADEQPALFPAVEKAMGNYNNPLYLKRLHRPHASMMQRGVYPDPANNRMLLLHGAAYTQDGYGDIAQYLKVKESAGGNGTFDIVVRLEFFPGDYGNTGDLGDFYLYLAGNINRENIRIKYTSGVMDKESKLNDLRRAAQLFSQFQSIKETGYRFTLADEAEAKAVANLYVEVGGTGKDIAVEGKDIISKNNRAYDLGLIAAYNRYGAKIFTTTLHTKK